MSGEKIIILEVKRRCKILRMVYIECRIDQINH